MVRSFSSLILLLLVTGIVTGQDLRSSKGSVERIKVHGKGLEANLEGDSADRFVSVYLPPSYQTQPGRRYPVIYFLHGFTDDDAKYFGLAKHWMNLVSVLDSVFIHQTCNDMILVAPNANTLVQGSWYSNSVTTGNWEDFICNEVVSYIDTHYRTMAKAASRGLAGHSMGGYGTLRIGERHPEIFSSIYLLSPAMIGEGTSDISNPGEFEKAERITSLAELRKADFQTKIYFAAAAAWSPNTANPPFYSDLPVKNGQFQSTILAKWVANMPLTTIDQYVFNLRQLHGIGFDAGSKDISIAEETRVLDEILNKYSLKHVFEIYEGTHTSRIAERIRLKVLPFFSSNLSFKQ